MKFEDMRSKEEIVKYETGSLIIDVDGDKCMIVEVDDEEKDECEYALFDVKNNAVYSSRYESVEELIAHWKNNVGIKEIIPADQVVLRVVDK